VLGDGKLAQLIALVLQAAGTRVVLYGKHTNKLAYASKAGIATKKVRGDAGATHDRTTRHAAAEIHLPRRRTRGNLAHRGERNHRRRFALWPLRQSHRAAAFRQSRPHAAHLAHLPAARRAPSHRLRPTIRCPESPSRRLITELGQLVSTGGSTTPGFV